MAFLSLAGVSKYFGTRVGVDDVTLDIGDSESVALFGPNGSGKTTLLRMLGTLSRPSEGTITLAGTPLTRDHPDLRGRIGVVSHETFLYDDLTARENLRFHARLHGVDRAVCEERLEAVGLADRAADRAGQFSHGMAKRLALARATLHDPDLLLLDEPFSGLDRTSLDRIRPELQGRTASAVVVATHDIEEGLNVADRVLMLANGRLVGDVSTADCDGPDALRDRYDSAVAGEAEP
jgi:ABC-type multidrug transport system ATPase subunit